MPLTTTHALVPLAGAIAFTNRPVPWKVVICAMIAAALPDLDWFVHRLLPYSPPVYWHRGAAHSLFVALAAGVIAATLHKELKVPAMTAGVVIAAAMASHGLLDMMTDTGDPVAYLWPLSSVRLFADWRPIHSGLVELPHFIRLALARQSYELWHLIVPMFAAAVVLRTGRMVLSESMKLKRR